MSLKGQSEGVFIVIIVIIGMLVIFFVLRKDPLQTAEVKSTQFSTEIASLLNTLILQDKGSAEIDFKGKYDVQVSYENGRHVIGVKGSAKTDYKKFPILLYPSLEDKNLERAFINIEKICLLKTFEKPFAEVVLCLND